MKTANDKQVGGAHYRADVQHWDWVEDNGLGYLEGCATKYISRWRKKNGLQDLEKSLHYLEKLLEKFLAGQRDPRGWATPASLEAFAAANGLNDDEFIAIRHISVWVGAKDLEAAIAKVKSMIEAARADRGLSPIDENGLARFD